MKIYYNDKLPELTMVKMSEKRPIGRMEMREKVAEMIYKTIREGQNPYHLIEDVMGMNVLSVNPEELIEELMESEEMYRILRDIKEGKTKELKPDFSMTLEELNQDFEDGKELYPFLIEMMAREESM